MIRKNFTMPPDTAKKLDFLAKVTHKKQSQIIQNLILKEAKKYEQQEKLNRLEKIKDNFNQQLANVSLQDIKGLANSE